MRASTVRVGASGPAVRSTTPSQTSGRRVRTFATRDAPRVLIAVAVGVLGLGTYLWQLSVPIYLQLYDSGVYLASAVHLVTGVLPYRDFAFVQPPGILVILSPVAVISRLVGTHDGFIVARVLSAVVTALDASVLSWLVRGRGRAAMVVSGAGLALTPVAVFFSSEIRLEPFCFLLVLLGSAQIVRGSSASARTTRSLLIAGVYFGLAAAVEFWAFFPFVAMVISVLPSARRRVYAFVLGAGAGLIVPCLAFLVLAPQRFVSQVFVEQLHHPRAGGSLARRLVDITGLAGTSIAPTGIEALGGFVVLGALVVVTRRWRREGGVIERYLLLASVISVVGLLAAPAAYTDYGYFAAPFLWGAVGVVTGRLVGPLRRWCTRVVVSTLVRRIVATALVAAALVTTAGVVHLDTSFYSLDLPLTGVSARAITSLSRTIPAGACVIYDTVGMGLLANRFVTSDPTCPHVVDPFGESMAWGYQRGVPAARAVAQWRSYLGAANYLVVAVPIVEDPAAIHATPFQGMIAWNASLLRWFARHYRLVNCDVECVYRRTT